MLKDIQKVSNNDLMKIDLISIYRSYTKLREWEEMEIVKSKNLIFIQEFEIAEVSF